MEDRFGGNLSMDKSIPYSSGLKENRQFPEEAPLGWGER
jgi:hypothetical protein